MNIKSVSVYKTHRPNALAGATITLEFPDGITLTVTDIRILPKKELRRVVWLAGILCRAQGIRTRLPPDSGIR